MKTARRKLNFLAALLTIISIELISSLENAAYANENESNFATSWTLTLGNNAQSASNYCSGTSGNIIHSFKIDITSAGSGNPKQSNLTGVSVTIGGTWVTADISNFKLLYNTSNSLTGSAVLNTKTNPATGVQSFTFTDLKLTEGTYYFFITADIALSAVNTHTLVGGAMTTTNFTSTDTKTGTAAASNTKTIIATPTAVITVSENSGTTNNDGIICNGASATLTASGGTTYSWSGGPSTAGYIVSPTSNTNYTVTVTSNGCSSTTNQTVTVNPIPIVNAGNALAAICQGGTSAALGGSYSGVATLAVWSDGGVGGTFANNTGTTPNTTTYTPPSSYSGTVTLTLTSSGGTCGVATATKTLTVNATPTVNVGSALSPVCQGGTTAALGGSFGGSTSAVWSANVAGGSFANNSGTTPGTTTYTAPTSYSGTIILTLTTSGGSCGTATASKNLTVNQTPTVSVGGVIAAICQGGTTAALGGSFGGGATAAVWSDGGVGGTFANNTGTTPNTTTYTPPSSYSGTVTLTLTSSGGTCGVATATKTLTVNATPTVNVGSALSPVCQGGTTPDLGGSFGGGATGAVWTADVSGGSFTNNAGSTPGTAKYSAPTSYFGPVTLTLTTSGGSCGTTAASKSVVVNLRPSVSFSTVPDASSCTGTDVTYTTQSGQANYTWTLPGTLNTDYTITSGGIGTSDNTVTLRWLTTGNKTVTINYANASGCMDFSAASFTTTVYNLPTLTSVSASTTAICEGTGATITLNGLLPNATQVISYSIQGGATLSIMVTSNGSGVATFTTNALDQTNSGQSLAIISISYSSGSGCVFTPGGSISPANLPTVNPVTLIEPVIAASPSDGVVCPGVNLTATLTAPGQNGSVSAVDEYRYTTDNGITWSSPWTTTIPSFAAVSGISKIEARRRDPAASGCSTSSSRIVSWTVVNNSVVSDPQPSAQGLCINGPVTALQVTASGGTGSYTYQWYSNSTNSNSGGTLISGATSATYTPPNNAVAVTYYYCVVSQAGYGCNPATSATAEVRVRTQSVAADITPDLAAGNICAGQAVSATFSGASGGSISATDIYEYSVNGGTTFTAYNPGDLINTGSLAGQTVIIRSSRSSTGPGCNFSGYKTVTWTVVTQPVSGTLTKIPNTASVCSGTNVSATASAGSGGAGIVADVMEYRFDGGAWTAYTSGTNLATATHSSVDIRTYRTSNGSGCTQSMPNITSWTITPLPTASIGVAETSGNTSNDGIICNGASVTLTASGGTSYSWSGGPATAGYTLSPAATNTYTVTVTASGCSSTANQTITVNSLPAPTFTTSPATTVCAGTDVTYTTQGGQSGYVWTFTGTSGTDYSITSMSGTLLTNSNSVILKWLKTTGSKTVTVKYTNTNGCSGTIIASHTINTVNAAPATPSISVSETSGTVNNDGKICAGDNVKLTATTVAGVTYSWTPAGGTVSGANNINYTVAPTATTIYTVTGTNSNGCTATDNTTITVNPLPTVYDLWAPGTQLSFCSSASSVTLTLTGSQSGYTYTFVPINPGGNEPPGQQFNVSGTGSALNVTLSPPKADWSYKMTATGPNGCSVDMNHIIKSVGQASLTTPLPTSTVVCSSSPTATITAEAQFAASTQWQVSTDNGATWSNIPNGAPYSVGAGGNYTASTSTLSISNVTSSMNGYQYRVYMTSTSPCGDAQSSATTLVYYVAAAINSQSTAAASYCQNAAATALSVTAVGSNITYQWYSNTTAFNSGGSAITGANLSSYTPPTGTVGTTYYYVVVTGSCGSATSAVSGAIVVNPPTILSGQPSGGSYCINGAATAMSVTATGVNLTYKWYSNTTNSNSGGTFITGATAASYIPPTTAAGTVYYYAEIAGACGVATSNAVAFTVVNPIATQPQNVSKCLKGSATFTVAATTPASVTNYQWYKVGNATPLSSCATCTSYTIPSVTAADAGDYYVVLSGSFPCGTFQSNNATLTTSVATSTTWAPPNAFSNDWTIDANWTCGAPTLTVDAIVPDVTPDQYPKIDAVKTGQAKDLTIQSTGVPTPNVMVLGLLQIAGTVNNSGYLDVTGGTVEYIGSSGTQNIAANTFANTIRNNTVQNIIISNNVNLNGALGVSGALTFGANGKTFATNDNLTLISDAAATARVGDLTNSTVSGNVTVERYIPAYASRRYRLVTAPVLGQTINQAWQDGMVYNDGVFYKTGTSTVVTPVNGQGTLITGQQMGSAANANPNGLDFWGAIWNSSGSGRYYIPSSTPGGGIWQPLSNTLTPGAFNSLEAYLLFVRGDHGYSVGTTPGATTLRPKGPLKTLSFSKGVPVNMTHTVLGNPYASPIDFYALYNSGTNSNAIRELFWIWQTSYGTGTGNFVLIAPSAPGSTVYEYIPNDGSNPPGTQNRLIHSGEGFLVEPKNFNASGSGANTVTIQEGHKASGTPPAGVLRQAGIIPAKLYINAFTQWRDKRTLVDGALAQYHPSFALDGSANVGKNVNTSENLAISRGGQDLIVLAGRGPQRGDTVQLRFWNTAAKGYELALTSRNFALTAPGLSAVLVDQYLQKETPVGLNGDTTLYRFDITDDAASHDPLRFYVVFDAAQAPLPLVVTELRAYQKGSGAEVVWKVENEADIQTYEVEKSADGTDFAHLATVAARAGAGPQVYEQFDPHPLAVGYYRIKMRGANGEVKYSGIVKLELQNTKENVRVYPNPTEDGRVKLQFVGKEAGKYLVTLVSSAGQQVFQKTIYHAGGNAVHALSLGANLASGSYTIEMKAADGKTESLPLQITR